MMVWGLRRMVREGVREGGVYEKIQIDAADYMYCNVGAASQRCCHTDNGFRAIR